MENEDKADSDSDANASCEATFKETISGNVYLSAKLSLLLMHAAAFGRDVMIRKLIMLGAQVKPAGDGKSALYWAIKQSHTRTAEILLEEGAPVDGQDQHGTTPLHLTVRFERLNIMSLLIRYGANLEARTIGTFWFGRQKLAIKGVTPLHIAAINRGRTSCLISLIKAGAHLKAETDYPDKKQAIHLAARAGHTEYIRILINAGVGVDESDGFKETPLMVAIHHDQLHVVKCLVSMGANCTDLVDRYGDNAATIARKRFKSGPELAHIKLTTGEDADYTQSGLEIRDIIENASTREREAILNEDAIRNLRVNDKCQESGEVVRRQRNPPSRLSIPRVHQTRDMSDPIAIRTVADVCGSSLYDEHHTIISNPN